MATRKQKQQLMDTLRFTPRAVEISISGYGGEIVMGRVARDTYDYWITRGDKLDEYVTAWLEDEEALAVPAAFQFVPAGSWYECDDIGHTSGAEMCSSSQLRVTDTVDNRVLLETELTPAALSAAGVTVEVIEDIDVDNFEPGTTLFVGQSVEKGVFFSELVDLNEPFDPRRMTIRYACYRGWPIMDHLVYAGEDIDGSSGICTRGKSMEFEMVAVEDPESDLVMPAEQAWELRTVDENSMTAWIPTDQHLPVYPGEYQVQVESTLYPTQFAIWSPDQGWQYDTGSPVVLPVKAWRGVNYPTF